MIKYPLALETDNMWCKPWRARLSLRRSLRWPEHDSALSLHLPACSDVKTSCSMTRHSECDCCAINLIGIKAGVFCSTIEFELEGVNPSKDLHCSWAVSLPVCHPTDFLVDSVWTGSKQPHGVFPTLPVYLLNLPSNSTWVCVKTEPRRTKTKTRAGYSL